MPKFLEMIDENGWIVICFRNKEFPALMDLHGRERKLRRIICVSFKNLDYYEL